MSRKTKTPRWLSIFRKLYTYLGATGLSTALAGYWGITDSDMVLIGAIYMYGAAAIQVICDAYFLTESDPLRKFPKEAKAIRE